MIKCFLYSHILCTCVEDLYSRAQNFKWFDIVIIISTYTSGWVFCKKRSKLNTYYSGYDRCVFSESSHWWDYSIPHQLLYISSLLNSLSKIFDLPIQNSKNEFIWLNTILYQKHCMYGRSYRGQNFIWFNVTTSKFSTHPVSRSNLIHKQIWQMIFLQTICE